ncbi:MAG TPA: DNA polymerase I [Candidatus Saccharimonadales bacterium]|nr:DNA polymerase I [Candidatus Saccharimonadales bacterium]
MADDTATKRKKLAVIDGKSVFYRGYYAMPNLSTKDGTPTGGVFGFATMALEVIKRLKPDYVAVAWDKPKTNIRRRLELYPEYKAGRKPAPADFKEQIPVLQELLHAFGWPLYELDDYEADDIMGTLAVQATAAGVETLLITSDLDMLQLVNPSVHVYALKKGLSNIELFSPESLEAKYGVRVDQMLDLKALKGDSSDNIPGVPGIGEKGAVQLLQQFEALDGIYENLGLIKDSIRRKLEAGKELAYLSKQLGAIWTDAPLTFNPEETDGTKADPQKILDLLQKLEFRSLARQLPEIMQVSADTLPSSPGITLKTGKNIVVDTNGKLLELADNLKKSDRFVVHSRAAGKHGKSPKVLIISPSAGRVFTILLDKVSLQHIYEVLQPFFSDESVKKVGHDIKSTLQVLYELGIDVEGIGHDTQIGAFLLDALKRDLSLTKLAEEDLGYEGSPFEDSDDEELVTRAPEIVAVIAALTDKQIAALRDMPKVAELAKNIEWPVIGVLAGMEYEGIRLDTDYMARFAQEINDMVSDYEQQIYGIAEQEFNIGSPTQLADILFEFLKLPTAGIKKGKTSYSTAASELDKLRGQHPIIDLITQYREVAKLKNTYVDTLPKMVDEQSRVHTTFNLTIAQTGRLSSIDPNLQNIPTRTELGRRVRTAFAAEQGNKLVSADYSQFELRLAAVMADDKELIGMFNRGADIHTATAALVYGRSPEDVTKGMRSAAKTINFGILYGMSPHGLSIATGMSRDQAVKFIERYKSVRRPLFDYMDRTRELARQQGYVETLLGRRRPMPDIHSSNFVVRQAAERAAINMPIQGTEADLMKMAMIEVDKLLKTEYPEAKQLLQVHDSILIECPAAVAEDAGKLLQETMQNIYKLPVRLDVDVTIADNWGEL